jgi:hypothetical protein
MTVRAPGDLSPDPSAFPPDESGAPPFENDVDLPWWQGGGRGFGYPPRGVTLTTPGGAVGGGGPNVVPPTNAPLRPGASPAIRPGGFGPATNATFPSQGGGGMFSNLQSFLPSILRNPYVGAAAVPAAIAAAGYKYGEPGREKLTVDPRIDAASSGGFDVGQPLGPAQPDAPVAAPPPAAAPVTPIGYRPEDDPSFTAPRGAPGRAGPPQMGMPWPDTGAAPAIGSPAPARPRVAAAPGSAVAAQRPNLGYYSPFTTLDYRPNSGPNERNRGSPVATALDLSRLFGGGQPAPAAAPAAAPYRSVTTTDPSRGLPVTPGLNPSGNLVLAGGNVSPGVVRSVPVPYPPTAPGGRRPKSSTSSQGGGQS